VVQNSHFEKKATALGIRVYKTKFRVRAELAAGKEESKM